MGSWISKKPVELNQPVVQPAQTTQPNAKKIVMTGDVGVGKSSLILQYTENCFLDKFISTIGVDFKFKTETFGPDQTPIKLQVWDTAGQERFRTITSSYYKGAVGVLLVFDLTARSSFEHIATWISEIEGLANQHDFLVLVGNKCDLVSQRVVQRQEAEAFAASHGLQYFETSAKQLESASSPFRAIAQQIFEGTPALPSIQATTIERIDPPSREECALL